MEANLEQVMNKLITIEEERSRQKALEMVEEKKIMALEKDILDLVEMVNKQ